MEYTATQNDIAKIAVINLQGRIVYEEKVSVQQGTNSFTVNLSNLASGLYVLKLETSDSKNVQKIIKK